jgi:hypothetical protein
MPAPPRVSISVTTPDGWTPELRTQLEAVAARAISRVVPTAQATLSAPDPERAARPDLTSGAATRERIDAARLIRDGYAVPSHRDEGRPVVLPTQLTFERPEVITAGPATAIVTDAEDVVSRHELPYVTVFHAPGNVYLFAGGSPNVASQNLARAVEWGRYLFARTGYAIWRRQGESGSEAFWTAGLRRALPLRELLLDDGTSTPTGRIGDLEVRSVGGAHSVYSPGLVAIVLPEGIALVDAGGPWTAGAFDAALRSVPREEAVVDRFTAQYVGWKLVQAARTDEAVLAQIVKLDRALFALVPWEERARYLELLVRGGLDDARRAAVLELIRATRAEAELEAMFALVRRSGVYDELFEDLDDDLFGLLVLLGELEPEAKLDWRYLVRLAYELGLSSGDPERGLDRAAQDALRESVVGLLEEIAFVFTRPGDVVAGVGHLLELLVLVDRAERGDLEAQAHLTALLSKGAESLAKAIRGLRYADRLGRPLGEREAHAEIAGDVLQRLRYALVLEVLSWFVGVGEIRAAVHAVRLPVATARVLAVLRDLGRLGRAARGAEAAARLERVLIALARVAKVGEDEARLARLVELLPDEHVGMLGTLAEAIDVPHGAQAADALLRATAGDAALEPSVRELRRSLAAAGRLDAKVGSAATTETAAGLQRLLRDATWPEQTLLGVIDEGSPANLAELMRTLTFVKPEHFDAVGAEAFKALVHRPRAMAFLREGGSSLFAATLRRAHANWAEIDRLVEGVAARKAALHDPVDYQRFLDRLAGSEAAVAEVTAAGLVARLRDAHHGALLAALDLVEDALLRNRWAAELARLSDRELDGLEAVAVGGADWIDVALGLDPANRLGFFQLVADVARRPGRIPVHGLERALKPFFESGRFDIQGAMGELETARTLIDGYGATEIWFQHRWADLGLKRNTDVVASIPGRGETHVEVKSHWSGRASLASFRWEVERDLVLHAPSEYRQLFWLFHPNVRPELPRLGRDMVELFSEKRVRDLFAARGLDVAKAEAAFQRWLDTGGLATY